MGINQILRNKWYKVKLNKKKKTFQILIKAYNKKSEGQKTIKSKSIYKKGSYKMCKFSHLQEMIKEGWSECGKKEVNIKINEKIVDNKTNIKTINKKNKLKNNKELLTSNKKESETIKNELENSIVELYDNIQKYEYSNIKILWRIETIVPYTFYSNMRNVCGVQNFTKIVHFYTIATQEEMCDLSECKIKYPYQYTDGNIYSEDYSFTCPLSNIYQVSNNKNFIESFTDQKWETINKEDFCMEIIQKVDYQLDV